MSWITGDELDPRSGEAHAALGMYHCFYAWEWEPAGRHLREAVISAPSYVMGHVMYAHWLIALGRSATGLAHIARALEIDPVSADTSCRAGDMMFFSGRGRRARRAARADGGRLARAFAEGASRAGSLSPRS